MLESVFAAHWIWIIAGVFIAGLEILVPGVFLLWLGLGALATGVLLLLLPDMSLAWQLLVFALSMLTSISLGFYVQRNSRLGPSAALMNRELYAMIGQRYVAITDFQAGQGRIRVADSSYHVLGDDSIRTGDKVEVSAIEGNTLRVVKADTP